MDLIDDLSGEYSNNLYELLNNPDKFTEINQKSDYIVTGSTKPKIIDTPYSGTIYSGKLIKNNTPNPVYIYRLDGEGKKIKPGKLIGVNKTFSVEAPIHALFQIADTNDNNLGIIYPSSALQYVSDISTLHTVNNNKVYESDSVVNDTKSEITIQWFDDDGNILQDGIVIKPNDSWKFERNTLYRIIDSGDNVLGTFLPTSGIINYVSSIDYMDSTDDSVLATGGISSKKFAGGNRNNYYIVTNNYSEPLSIYPKNKESFIDKPEVILPGETWEINTKNNNLYKITTEDGKCLGTFLPTEKTTKITDVIEDFINTDKSVDKSNAEINYNNSEEEKKVEYSGLLDDPLIISLLLIILVVIIEIACFKIFDVPKDSIIRVDVQ